MPPPARLRFASVVAEYNAAWEGGGTSALNLATGNPDNWLPMHRRSLGGMIVRLLLVGQALRDASALPIEPKGLREKP